MSVFSSIKLRNPVRSKHVLFSLGWSTASQIVGTLIKLVSTILLTRLLSPEAYAILGVAMTAMTMMEWLADIGVMPALIRHPDGGQPNWLLAGWWVNLARGLLLSALAAALSYPLTVIYQQPALLTVMLALSIRPIVMALRSPAIPVLRRKLDYRLLFVDDVGQTLIGAIVAISIAYFATDAGVWALVAGTLAAACAGVVISYAIAPLKPKWHWEYHVVHHLIHFGSAIFINTLAMACWLSMDRLLGARLLSLESLGLYMIAWNLSLVVEGIATRLTDVYFALLTRLPADDRVSHHNRTMKRICGGIAPVFLLGTVLAPLAINIMYDVRYQHVGLLLSILIARLSIRLVGQFDFQLLLANGAMRNATYSYVAAAIVQAIAIPLLVHAYGVHGLAISVFVSTFVSTGTQALLCQQLGINAVCRLLICTAVAAVALMVTNTLY